MSPPERSTGLVPGQLLGWFWRGGGRQPSDLRKKPGANFLILLTCCQFHLLTCESLIIITGILKATG